DRVWHDVEIARIPRNADLSALIVGYIANLDDRGLRTPEPAEALDSLRVHTRADAPRVQPGDDRARRAVRRDRGVELAAAGGAQGHAVGGPLRGPGGAHVLCVDVEVVTVAEVVPGNNRAACPIRDNGRARLIVGGCAERRAVGDPSRHAPGVHP